MPLDKAKKSICFLLVFLCGKRRTSILERSRQFRPGRSRRGLTRGLWARFGGDSLSPTQIESFGRPCPETLCPSRYHPVKFYTSPNSHTQPLSADVLSMYHPRQLLHPHKYSLCPQTFLSEHVPPPNTQTVAAEAEVKMFPSISLSFVFAFPFCALSMFSHMQMSHNNTDIHAKTYITTLSLDITPASLQIK